METILVVCHGNVCRSPVGEALLLDRLAAFPVKVTSAGTHAAVGRFPVPEAVEYVARRTGIVPTSTAVQLSASQTLDASLIMTMTEAQRTWVVHHAPRAVRRTYTVRELARISEMVVTRGGTGSIAEFASICAGLRSQARAPVYRNDVPDPFGGPANGYLRSFDLIAEATQMIGDAIVSQTATVARTVDHLAAPSYPAEELS